MHSKIFGQTLAAIDDRPAGRDLRVELAQRDLVHRNQNIRTRNHRRADAIFRKTDMAVRAARAHLWTVGRQPADFQSFAHAHLRQKLSEQQDTLPSEAGDLDAQVAEVMLPLRCRPITLRLALAFHQFGHGFVRRNVVVRNFDGAVAETRSAGNSESSSRQSTSALPRDLCPRSSDRERESRRR